MACIQYHYYTTGLRLLYIMFSTGVRELYYLCVKIANMNRSTKAQGRISKICVMKLLIYLYYWNFWARFPPTQTPKQTFYNRFLIWEFHWITSYLVSFWMIFEAFKLIYPDLRYVQFEVENHKISEFRFYSVNQHIHFLNILLHSRK